MLCNYMYCQNKNAASICSPSRLTGWVRTWRWAPVLSQSCRMGIGFRWGANPAGRRQTSWTQISSWRSSSTPTCSWVRYIKGMNQWNEFEKMKSIDFFHCAQLTSLKMHFLSPFYGRGGSRSWKSLGTRILWHWYHHFCAMEVRRCPVPFRPGDGRPCAMQQTTWQYCKGDNENQVKV